MKIVFTGLLVESKICKMVDKVIGYTNDEIKMKKGNVHGKWFTNKQWLKEYQYNSNLTTNDL